MKGELIMIRSKDFNQEVNALNDKVKKTPDAVTNADAVKAILLVGKLLRDVRTNQVLALKDKGVKLVESERDKATDVEKK